MHGVCARTRDEGRRGEETRKETERKSENANAGAVRWCLLQKRDDREGGRMKGPRRGTRVVARRRGMGNCNEQLDSYK